MDNKISIIVPAYNLEQYLPRTLDSILAQNYRNIEVIVVNDGSRDGTAAIIDGYAARDGRVKAVHKENGGVTSARLRGVAEATGDWVGFVDGDDYIEPDMYERLLDNALKYGADISHCGYRMVFPSRVDWYYNTGKLLPQDHNAGLRDLMEGRFIEPGMVIKLYRRSLFAGLAEKMDSSIRINEDTLMNYWLFREAETSIYEDFCPYHYILREGSASSSRRNEHHLRDPMKVIKTIYRDADEVLRPVVLGRLIRLLIYGASMDLGDQPELIAPHRKACRRELRQRLFGALTCSGIGLKLKLMALFTALFPSWYGKIHDHYMKASGLDKLYDIT